MIEIPMDKLHGERADKCPANVPPCIVCGRPCRDPRWMIHLYSGLYAVTEKEMAKLAIEDEKRGSYGDCGMYPIGSDCLRKHPELKEYAQKQRGEQS